MKIKLTTVYVNDQAKALRFYTEVLGFSKKADFSQGPYRWLTVTAPNDPDGVELQLAAADDAAAAFQKARLDSRQPMLMLFTDDIKGDCEGISKRGGELAMPPTEVTASTIAQVADGCGNLVQLTQLQKW